MMCGGPLDRGSSLGQRRLMVSQDDEADGGGYGAGKREQDRSAARGSAGGAARVCDSAPESRAGSTVSMSGRDTLSLLAVGSRMDRTREPRD